MLFLLPGLALGQGCMPGLGRLWTSPPGAGGLSVLAYGYAASFLLLTPASLLCYASGAPLWVFSVALCCNVLLAAFGLMRSRAYRSVWKQTGHWSMWLTYAILGVLLWLQARLGGWLDGDATYHLARMRVLLEHGFDNRDIYLREPRFQHAYHNNLLLPVYASLAQLTRQNQLTSWFYSEAWAKLLVAAGHYVFAFTLTRKRSVGLLLAVCMLTLNAGETYALYPNTLCVGFLLPMLLAFGVSCLGAPRDEWRHYPVLIATGMFVLAQLHGVYAVYTMLLLGPLLTAAVVWPRRFEARVVCLAALLGLTPALPFVLTSAYGFRNDEPLQSAPDQLAPPEVAPVRPAGLAEVKTPPAHVAAAASITAETPTADAGHLEKVLDATDSGAVVFKPERMGGLRFVWFGAACSLLACGLYVARRLQLMAACAVALWLGVLLFVPTVATIAAGTLQGHFVVARLSTVLTTLLVFGICACVSWPWACERLPAALRKFAYAVLSLVLACGATFLPGHAPVRFGMHVTQALAPEPERHARLELLLARQTLLRERVPAGSTVLTTPRFARQVVMLRDCYVLAADRGHTHVVGIDKRRRDLVFLNAADTPWSARERLIRYYGLRIVTFERRWQQRYAWAYQHGTLLGSVAGEDVIELSN
jgi:hypothetical protein